MYGGRCPPITTAAGNAPHFTCLNARQTPTSFRFRSSAGPGMTSGCLKVVMRQNGGQAPRHFTGIQHESEDKHVKTRLFVVLCAVVSLFLELPNARAGDVCWIHRAVRNGDTVKVVFSKGLMPPSAIIHPNGSRDFVNGAVVESPGKVVERNPHTFVILHKGDRLGLMGIDSGCTVSVVHIRGVLELKMDGGRFIQFLPVEDAKRSL